MSLDFKNCPTFILKRSKVEWIKIDLQFIEIEMNLTCIDCIGRR